MIWLALHFRTRDVVNTVITFGDQPIDVLDANLGSVGQLQRATRHKSAGRHTKYDCFEDRLVFLIEWAINENASAGRRWHAILRAIGTLSLTFKILQTLSTVRIQYDERVESEVARIATSAFDELSRPRYDKLWHISVLRVVVSFLFRIAILCLNAHGIWYLVAGQ